MYFKIFYALFNILKIHSPRDNRPFFHLCVASVRISFKSADRTAEIVDFNMCQIKNRNTLHTLYRTVMKLVEQEFAFIVR